jgi:isoamylase
VDFTGTGNSIDSRNPAALRLISDSLRYWVEEFHVDGFRFDLATTLAREDDGFDPRGGFLDIVRQDPVLAQVKLIAEPWDLGEGGYQVGRFPAGWSEWNGRYRDTMRSYWRGDGGVIGEVASRLSGSSDLYAAGGRKPHASVNFITAHDGFTLHDLVSYNDKHNEANGDNGDNGGDGETHNGSWNCGVEGPTSDPAIIALRELQKRNLLATLMFSQGVPMLVAGDEFGRTQQGNNNAYCQDTALSWFDWDLLERHADICRFVKALVEFRQRRAVVRNKEALSLNQLLRRAKLHWHGVALHEPDWNDYSHSLAFTFESHGGGFRMHGMLNAYWQPLTFALPPVAADGPRWRKGIDTALTAPDDIRPLHEAPVIPADHLIVQPRSVVVLAQMVDASGHSTGSGQGSHESRVAEDQ